MQTKFRYRIEQDNDPSNPRTEHDNLGQMVCWHRRYNLGDEQPKKSITEWLLFDLLNLYGDDKLKIGSNFYTADSIAFANLDGIVADLLKKAEKDYIILPLYLYDHSGITMNTSGFSYRWDSGQVGFIYLSKADARKEYKRNWVKMAKKYLECEVETYDAYISGEVYGYVIESYYEDENGEEVVEDDHYDYCWGFYGHEHCEEQAKELVEHLNSPEQQFKMAEDARLHALMTDDSCEVFAANFATA